MGWGGSNVARRNFAGPHLITSHAPPFAAAASRRAVLRALACAVSLPALAGCARLANVALAPDAAEVSVNPTLLVATTRKPVDDAHSEPWFGPERASRLSVARAKLASPTEGRLSSLSSSGLDDWRLESVETVPRVANLLADATSARDVLIYVHGFNQTFETAAIDAVHLAEGVKFHGETMVFSWPSKARLYDYGYDRESAMWSRDALDRVVGRSPCRCRPHSHRGAQHRHNADDGDAAHSTRGRQGACRESARSSGRAGYRHRRVLRARTALGPHAKKITVVTSTNDRALAVAGWIAGGVVRVGAADGELEKLGLQVIDASQEGCGIINHDLFLSNVHIRKVIRNSVDGHPGTGA